MQNADNIIQNIQNIYRNTLKDGMYALNIDLHQASICKIHKENIFPAIRHLNHILYSKPKMFLTNLNSLFNRLPSFGIPKNVNSSSHLFRTKKRVIFMYQMPKQIIKELEILESLDMKFSINQLNNTLTVYFPKIVVDGIDLGKFKVSTKFGSEVEGYRQFYVIPYKPNYRFSSICYRYEKSPNFHPTLSSSFNLSSSKSFSESFLKLKNILLDIESCDLKNWRDRTCYNFCGNINLKEENLDYCEKCKNAVCQNCLTACMTNGKLTMLCQLCR